jgi:hypothetical protein
VAPQIRFTARADLIVRGRWALPRLAALGVQSVELGIESGSPSALARFNKQVSVEENASAIRALKAHGIGVGVDFIMFDPDTLPEELDANLVFLAAQGLAERYHLLFHRLHLLPGTAYHARLQAEGRLHGNPEAPATCAFRDARTTGIWEQAQVFQQDVLPALDACLAEVPRAGAGAAADPEVAMLTYALARTPYQFMRALVDQSLRPTASQYSASPLAEYCRQAFTLIHQLSESLHEYCQPETAAPA